ncbi:MAG: FtsX-like permease family protein, partial [Moritella sp.]|uniref:ABC transporter permease n=1 Tax=Moritella sp. TaxID=78556 RepID=UPI0029AD1529
YRDDPSVVNSFAMPDAAFSAAMSKLPVTDWAVRIKVPAVIASERDTRGVILQGVDADKEQAFGFTQDQIIAGHYLPGLTAPEKNRKGIIIGQKLVEKLETKLGRRIVIMSQDPDNNLVDRGFIITGIYSSTIPGFEELNVYADRRYIEKILHIPNQISEISILGQDYNDVTALTAYVKKYALASLETLNWLELDSYLRMMSQVMDSYALVWILVIFLALSFGLVNTLMMAVFERIREIGLMRALGMRGTGIIKILLLESSMLLVLGLIIGNALSLLMLYLIRDGIDLSSVADGMAMFGYGAVLHAQFILSDLLLANGVVISLGLLICLYPAWKASRYDPIIALNKY